MFGSSSTDALKCPITCELFHDPVIGSDNHTYERNAITIWLQKKGTSPITSEPMAIDTLRPNHTIKKLIDEFKSSSSEKHFIFELGTDIKKVERRPIFQALGKSIYKAEWIAKQGPPIVLLKIEGAKANREAAFYVQLGSHPHIVHTYGVVERDPNYLMLVQEYATEGDLAELLRENEFQPSQPVLIEIFLQIIEAMISLANYDIVHGDLACRNVLVFRFNNTEPQENLVKLTDFGLTRASKLYSVVGTGAATTLAVVPIRYVAPEILQSSGLSNYSEKSDVYSMGVLMWEACSQGQVPYASIDDDNEVRRCKLRGELLSKPNKCDEDLWNIIVRCWHQRSEDRPTFKMLKQLLKELQLRPPLRPLDIQDNDVNRETLNTDQNTVKNIRQAEESMVPSTSNEPSFIPKVEMSTGHLSFNDDLSTEILVECEFCNKKLPGLSKFIHDRTSVQLILDHQSIDDEGAKHIAEKLQDNKLLKTVNLRDDQITHKGARYIAKALRQNQTITKLDLSYNSIGDIGAEHLADAIRSNQTLASLNLPANKIDAQVMQLLAEAIQYNQTLTTLKIPFNGISHIGAQHLANALRTNQVLTTLDIYGNGIGVEGAKHFADLLSNNQILTSLELGDNHIETNGAQHLAIALQKNQKLSTLDLRSNYIGIDGIQSLADALRTNQTLTTLDIVANNIGPLGIKSLAKALQNNQKLVTLKISGNEIGDEGTQYLADMLRNNQTLTTLDISVNNIGSEGIKTLAEALQNNQKLDTLIISWNQIDDERAKYLSQAILDNHTLISLYLDNNKIGDIGAQHLVEALTSNKTLLTLSIRGNNISDNHVKSFQNLIKNNEIPRNVLFRWND